MNVTKSIGHCGFDHIYGRNTLWKVLIFVQCFLVYAPCNLFIIYSLTRQFIAINTLASTIKDDFLEAITVSLVNVIIFKIFTSE